MAWTNPKTFTAASVLTAAELNIYVRDNMNHTGPAVATAGSRLIVTNGANLLAERIPTTDAIQTAETTSSTSYTDLATVGPAVTVTTGTAALLILTAQLQNATSDLFSLVSVEISGATTLAGSSTRGPKFKTASANDAIQCSTMHWLSMTAGSNTFTMKYAVTGGTGTFANRELTVIPF